MASTAAAFRIRVQHEVETARLGRELAGCLRPGDVVALSGDLGAGKTRLTQAIASGLGALPEDVNSPTFTLIQEYSGRWPIRHCDVYRLRQADEFVDLGLDELFADDGIALVEWANRVADYLPRDRLEIRLTAVGPTSRDVEFIGWGRRGASLVEAVRTVLQPAEST